VIRVVLPAHLRTLAQVTGDVHLDVKGQVTQRAVLDALEGAYPALRGTLRDHVTQKRRPFVRFFACGEDLSHESPDAPLPEAVAAGAEPFLVVGAIAGGAPTNPEMTWEKSSPELADFFAGLVPKAAKVEQKKMFGWPCAFVNGNLFAGLHKQSMIFRLSDDDHAKFLQLDGASDFEPMPGRKMKGYVILADPLTRDKKEMSQWMNRALEFTSAPPPKSKSAAKPSAGSKRASKR
jgi:TfoX/Sxy family transcriptional regulator of competence genes